MAEKVNLRVVKRPVIVGHQRRMPGEVVSVAAGEMAELERQYPGGFRWLTAPKKPELLVSPAAQKLADEIDIDLEKVEGSGKDGMITKADVERYAHIMATLKKIMTSMDAERSEPETQPEPETEPIPDEAPNVSDAG